MKEEIKCNVFKPYPLSVDDIDAMTEINLIDKCIQQFAKDLDSVCCDFLISQGYKIDKPYNMEQLKEIKEDLAKKDRVLDTIELIRYEGNTIHAKVIPFLNCISNPLSENERQNILKKWELIDDRKIRG